MKKLIIFFFALSFFSCNNAGKELDSKPLIDFLSKQIDKPNGKLDLTDFNGFDWDLVHVLPPYSVVTKDDKLISSAASAIERTGINYRDDVSVLVFFNKNKLVGTMEVGRKIDFALLGERPNNRGRSFNRKDCVFAYRTLAGGDFIQLSAL